MRDVRIPDSHYRDDYVEVGETLCPENGAFDGTEVPAVRLTCAYFDDGGDTERSVYLSPDDARRVAAALLARAAMIEG